ncbi:MAG TPA: hypothetical protein PLO62_10380, partial [Candidatus Hydrogenedentes bacterium]|nr:hypothetical protein [Candidatus Hydrogenedentota bacterium]
MPENPSPSRPPEFVGARSARVRFPSIPRRLKRIIALVLVVAVIPLALIRSFFVYVHPDQYGIKEVKIGIHRGI